MTQMTASPTGAALATPTAVPSGPIVIAVGGEENESVLRAARILASHVTGGVLAVAVQEPPPAALIGGEAMLLPPSYVDEQRAALAAQLTARLQAFGGAAVTWHTKIVSGEPALALTDLARSVHAPLLVMGIGRHRPLDRIFGAETTLRAIRIAACPVLAVHPDLDAPFHDVVLAIDFSPASAHAAQVILPLLDANATVHLILVWQPTSTTDSRAMAADEAYRQALPDRFHRLIELLEVPSGVELKTIVREGRPAERVLDYATMHHADLIVAGRHGLNPLQRLVVGSQTTTMLRAANRSLLVAPEPSFAELDQLRLVLTGVSRSTDPAEWEAQLAAFTRRNKGRLTVLDIDELVSGARLVESGYVLLGAGYDPATKRVELTLGDPQHETRRVTRVIGTVDSIDVSADPVGQDVALRITHGGGQTALTFAGNERAATRIS
jgi:nucleotide-binding universal stress UspA family protein